MGDRAFLGQGLKFPFEFQRKSGAPRLSTADSAAREHIRESVMQILGTDIGERFMNPDFGSGLRRCVFEPDDTALRGLVRHYVFEAVRRWEPRIRLLAVDFPGTDADRHFVPVRLTYRIIATQTEDNLVYPFYREAGR